MTPEEIEDLVLRPAPPEEVRAAFSGLTEADRKKLSKFSQGLVKQLHTGRVLKDASEPLREHLGYRSRGGFHMPNMAVLENAIIAQAACGPPSAIMRDRNRVGDNASDALVGTLEDRAPAWLGDWVEWDRADHFPALDFERLRDWIKNGLCERPEPVTYFGFIAGYVARYDHKIGGFHALRSDTLRREPELIEHVWPIFETDNGMFEGQTWYKKYPRKNAEHWSDTLLVLEKEGLLDRARLLDTSLAALDRDFRPAQLSGLHALHKALRPSADEIALREDRYRALLAHPVSHVSSFALAMLSALEKPGRLDVAKFLPETAPILVGGGKSAAKTTLRLLGRLAKRKTGNPAEILQAAAQALQSEHADVQEMVLELLELHATALPDPVRAQIESALDFVSPPLQPRARALTGASGPVEPDHPEPAGIDRETLETTVANLPAARRRALGLDAMMSGDALVYQTISENILDHEILPVTDPLEPIETVEELVQLVSHTTERMEDPDEVERILDGISRLCGQRDAEFPKLTEPLLHRIESGGGESFQTLLAFGSIGLNLSDLVRSWLTGKSYKKLSERDDRRAQPLDSVVPMLQLMAERAVDGIPAQMLSTPTHTGGWLGARVWVERLIENERTGAKYDEIDLCLSLLRLAPDGRTEALTRASELSGPEARIARFALGGDVALKASDAARYDVWICAARSRDPNADWTETLAPLRLASALPDALRPATREWDAQLEKSYGQTQYGMRAKTLRVQVNAPRFAPKPQKGFMGRTLTALSGTPRSVEWRRVPCAAVNYYREDRYHFGSFKALWESRWIFHIWPLQSEGAWAQGARQLSERTDKDASSWEPVHGYVSALFQKNRPWREMGHLVLALGLSGKDVDARGLAVDAFIEGVESGQFDPTMLASVLTKFTDGNWVKLNRLGETLAVVAQTSPLHAWLVGEAIQLWLPGVPPKYRNLFSVLEALQLCRAVGGRPLHAPVEVCLSAFSGSSKAAKLAKQILKGDGLADVPDAALRLMAVEARLRTTGCEAVPEMGRATIHREGVG